MKKLLGALALITSLVALPAYAWDVKEMNEEIEQTNFIVGSGCSGTLISAEHRLILTNNHCVDNLVKKVKKETIDDDGVIQEIQVVEKEDLKVYQKGYQDYSVITEMAWVAEIVDYDKKSDLAIVQIISDIPHTVEADIYSGGRIYPGETVYTVGNPSGFDLTVSKGVVSSVNRSITIGGNDHKYFQVDAAITPGNSGGSLYNEDGELIGVPGAFARGTRIGLAVPYTEIHKLLEENCYSFLYDDEAPSYLECMDD